jgi:hypothetical protein
MQPTSAETTAGDFGTVAPGTREIVAHMAAPRVAVHEALEELDPDYSLKRRSGPRRQFHHIRNRPGELCGLQRPGDLVRTEDDAGRHCVRADQLE